MRGGLEGQQKSKLAWSDAQKQNICHNLTLPVKPSDLFPFFLDSLFTFHTFSRFQFLKIFTNWRLYE